MVKLIPGTKTTVEDVYIANKANSGHFRPGEWAKVIDLVWLTPSSGGRRLCAHILYEDGFEDYVVFDLLQFDIMSETDYRGRA